MSHIVVEPAPWIADLPREGRGFVIPAEAGWDGDVAVLSKVGTDRKVALGMRRCCALCGFVMPKGSPVYRAFAQGDAAHMRQFERKVATDPSGPLHLSCILYSAMACPYLRERTSRLTKTSEINPGGRRGTRAAIMGFGDFGLMLHASAHQFLDPAPHFAYLELVEDIGYRDGEELRERYQAAVVSDESVIDTSKPRLFWTSNDADLKQLGLALRADFKTLDQSEPAFFQDMQGVGRFAVFPR
ncbi:hypothetical protein ACFVWF_23760 [Rhodococcus qingshengii]|uniref:hypothetical protein n=1 Tax=Rhodococcus qingshengii TaxID=334542 RepID=UPI0036DEA66B